MSTLLHFFQYHNAVPIAFGILFLGGASAFAATNPEAVYSAQEEVIAIDNSYIATKDLSAYTPRATITDVVEDEDNFYVTYDFATIDLADSVWQDVVKQETMTVSKADLGAYRDLGLYVMDQLKQKVDREIAYLKEVQDIEKQSITHKTVATTYGGLIGAMLDEKTESLPGYTPVVVPPEPEANVAAAAAAVRDSGDGEEVGQEEGQGLAIGSFLSGDDTDTEAPFVQVLGRNPITIQEGDTYLDLGAVAADSGRTDTVVLGVYLDGEKVSRIYMQSAMIGDHHVVYEATDRAGNITRAERVVVVVAKQEEPDVSEAAPEAEEAATTTEEMTPDATTTDEVFEDESSYVAEGEEEALGDSPEETATTTPERLGPQATSTDTRAAAEPSEL